MYAWKCWRETRTRFFFLLTLFVAIAILITLMPGFKERNGSLYFDRSEYTHDPPLMVKLVSLMILSGVWGSGFFSAVFLGATSPGSEIELGTIEYLWTRPRTRTSITLTHWGICLAEILVVAVVPTYLAATLLGTLTGNWHQPLLLGAPWLIVIVGLPMLGLTTLMTALRRSASGGLLYTGAVVAVYVILRQIANGLLHLQLPPLFAGPLLWLMTNNQPNPSAFPWGSLGRGVFLAVAFSLVAQYLLKGAEV
jgi:ABC-type transport system involved in multi-copper enzyme maturation permease subunit